MRRRSYAAVLKSITLSINFVEFIMQFVVFCFKIVTATLDAEESTRTQLN